jgi:hypothetical protein
MQGGLFVFHSKDINTGDRRIIVDTHNDYRGKQYATNMQKMVSTASQFQLLPVRYFFVAGQFIAGAVIDPNLVRHGPK